MLYLPHPIEGVSMKFENAKKYTSGTVVELQRGKKYKLTLKYKDYKGKWQNKPSRTVAAKGKKEALALLKEFQKEQEKALTVLPAGISTNNKSLTVEQAVLSYLDFQKNTLHELEESTYTIQLSKLKRNAFPYIGNVTFEDLDVVTINSWWAELSKQGLSQGYIRSSFASIAKVYAYHYKMENIPTNPFEHLAKKPKEGHSKVTHLDAEQTEKFYDAINSEYPEGSAYWTAFNIAYLSGLRRGEICGLRWVDVNFTTHQLTVSSAIGEAKGGTYTKNPKNESSRRTFVMINQLFDVLQFRYKVIQEKEGEVKKNWFVCGNCEEYIKPNKLTKEFQSLTRAYDLKDVQGNYVTIHSLRHNFATQAAASNIDIKSLQKMLGHANAAMTLNTYANDSADAMRAASEKLSDANAEMTPYLLYNGYEDLKIPSKVEIENAIDVLKRAGYNVEMLSKGIAN
jgi:integrase